jgi:hypothetical protein
MNLDELEHALQHSLEEVQSKLCILMEQRIAIHNQLAACQNVRNSMAVAPTQSRKTE